MVNQSMITRFTERHPLSDSEIGTLTKVSESFKFGSSELNYPSVWSDLNGAHWSTHLKTNVAFTHNTFRDCQSWAYQNFVGEDLFFFISAQRTTINRVKPKVFALLLANPAFVASSDTEFDVVDVVFKNLRASGTDSPLFGALIRWLVEDNALTGSLAATILCSIENVTRFENIFNEVCEWLKGHYEFGDVPNSWVMEAIKEKTV